MKAIVFTKFGSTEVLQLKEVPKPIPKEYEVLVKIHATAINDWDWNFMRGKPYLLRLIYGLFKPKVNILGVDIAGQIESVGRSVKKFQPGDEVYGDLSESGFGGFAQYVCANENALASKPANMSFETAASIPHAAMLAVQGLIDKGKIQEGQKLLINGAGGGVGIFGVQIAKLYHAETTGVDSLEKLDMMRSIGFDHVIDYKEEDFTKNGQKYDLILDTKTTRSTFAYARSLNPNGTYVTVGGHLNRIFQVLILGKWISMFNKKKIWVLGLKPNKGLDYLNGLFEAGKIKTVIDGPFKLSEVPKAVQYFGDGKHKGKIVITVEHEDTQ